LEMHHHMLSIILFFIIPRLHSPLWPGVHSHVISKQVDLVKCYI
jgi:hypothetical protein